MPIKGMLAGYALVTNANL